MSTITKQKPVSCWLLPVFILTTISSSQTVWEKISPIPTVVTPNSISSVTYGGNNLFVATMYVFDTTGILISGDGQNWSIKTVPKNVSRLRGITYGYNLYVAVSSQTPGHIITSPDGTTWTERSGGGQNNAVCYGNYTFTAVGSNNVASSENGGITWKAGAFSGASLLSVTYGNNLFVAVGSSGNIVTSPDGLAAYTWTKVASGLSVNLNSITCANDMYVIAGDAGKIYTSPNAKLLTEQNTGTTYDLNSVIYENGIFIAVGDYGTIITSPDAIHWTTRTSGITSSLRSVAYGDNTFVAVGDTGTIIRSKVDVPTGSLKMTHSGFYGDIIIRSVKNNIVANVPFTTGHHTVTVTSTSGKTVYTSHVVSRHGTVTFPVSTLARGTYLVTIRARNNTVFSSKLVISGF